MERFRVVVLKEYRLTDYLVHLAGGCRIPSTRYPVGVPGTLLARTSLLVIVVLRSYINALHAVGT